jgi:GxxExxY protein
MGRRENFASALATLAGVNQTDRPRRGAEKRNQPQKDANERTDSDNEKLEEMMTSVADIDRTNDVFRLCDVVRETSFAIHKFLKQGHLERVYENPLVHRLRKAGLTVAQQVPVPVFDEDGTPIGDYVVDLLVNDILVVELKACRMLGDEHTDSWLPARLSNGARASRQLRLLAPAGPKAHPLG